MTAKISEEVKGLKESQRRMEQVVKDLRGSPMINAMRDSTLLVTRDAKINAPVDTGRLRASITPEVSSDAEEIRGVVGSNVTYAPFQEFGTRFMQGRFYLQRAFEANRQKIEARFNQAVTEIASKE